MKILFTSDLHGNLDAINDFAQKLKDYDLGIIAGDIIDDGMPDNEMQEMSISAGLTPDDFIPELPDADDSLEEAVVKAMERIYSPDSPWMIVLNEKENKIKHILNKAGKPIFLISGNHDLTAWKSEGNIVNIHEKKIKFKGLNFVGYKWTSLHRYEEDHKNDIKKLKKKVGKKTIFVSHTPAAGVLDGGFGHNGSKDIKNMIDKKKPLFHLHGHVHSTWGVEGNTVNGSYPELKKFYSIDTESKDILLV